MVREAGEKRKRREKRNKYKHRVYKRLLGRRVDAAILALERNGSHKSGGKCFALYPCRPEHFLFLFLFFCLPLLVVVVFLSDGSTINRQTPKLPGPRVKGAISLDCMIGSRVRYKINDGLCALFGLFFVLVHFNTAPFIITIL